MDDSKDDSFDPTSPERREIGREIVDESGGLGSAMAHLYRGEMDRMTTWRQRLDQTTYWAVTLMAAILTWTFSSRSNPHYILLIGMVAVSVFLQIEARRYRGYDVWRSRVRILQENLFSYALDPSQGIERENWRTALGEDLQNPSPKLSNIAAAAHRLRRVYFSLLSVLLLAWIGRITMYTPGESWPETAAIGVIPGLVVIVLVGLAYLGLIALLVLPGEHHVRGEIYESDLYERD